MLNPHLKYLSYVLRHKWFVFVECCKLGIPLPGIVHDWSKFLPSEWFPYAHSFYGERTEQVKVAFDIAWLLHQKRNPHHWQWWLLLMDSPKSEWATQAHQPEVGPYYLAYRGQPLARFETPLGDDVSDEAFQLVRIAERALASGSPKVLAMPDRYRREMLADWRGAGRAQGKPDTLKWYEANQHKMSLHPETRTWIERQLGYVGDDEK